MTPAGLAERLHAQALVIDGHNDLAWEIREKAGGSFERLDISQPRPELHTDIPRACGAGAWGTSWTTSSTSPRWRGRNTPAWVRIPTGSRSCPATVPASRLAALRRPIWPSTWKNHASGKNHPSALPSSR